MVIVWFVLFGSTASLCWYWGSVFFESSEGLIYKYLPLFVKDFDYTNLAHNAVVRCRLAIKLIHAIIGLRTHNQYMAAWEKGIMNCHSAH